jgi:hypothetical protein
MFYKARKEQGNQKKKVYKKGGSCIHLRFRKTLKGGALP